MSVSAHLLLGKRGEDLATQHLANEGYQILARNVRLGRDEIDIIAHDPTENVLIFAEVKTRAHMSEAFRPELNADARKVVALRRAARAWVVEKDYDGGYRLDLVCVANGKVVNHIKELAWE